MSAALQERAQYVQEEGRDARTWGILAQTNPFLSSVQVFPTQTQASLAASWTLPGWS